MRQNEKDLGADAAVVDAAGQAVPTPQLSHAGSGRSDAISEIIRAAIYEAYQTWFLWKGDLQLGAWSHSDGVKFQQMLLKTERRLIAKYTQIGSATPASPEPAADTRRSEAP